MIDYLKRKLHNLTHPVLGRILMLHRVVEHRSEGANRELEVTPQFLEQTVKEYRQQGYQFVTIDQLTDLILNSKFRIHNSRMVCLTFDDGYNDNYTLAYPLLKRLDVPFAIYVTTGFIDNRLPIWWYPGEQLGICAESLKALDADPLCTICAHTVSHPKLDALSPEEQKREIVQSRQELEALLSHPIDHFSYPHGAYNDETISIVRENGFHTALMAWGGTVRRGDNPFLLHRIELKQVQ